MKRLPLVTVLMAVYNGQVYLKGSIESILSQTYRNFEFLIINDCSTDNTLEIVKSYSDDRIKLYSNKKNIGQTKSLNVGLKLAKGKYVARMDADDKAYPEWLSKIVENIEKEKNITALGTSAIVINNTGTIKEIRRMPLDFDEIIFRIFFAPPINHVSVIIKRKDLIKLGGYDEEFNITQDYELWSEMIRKKYCIKNISDILIAYRVHSNSLGFIESNNRGMLEKSETIFRNINSLTCLKIRKTDAMSICKLFYQTNQLTLGEIVKTQELFKDIYRHLNIEYRISEAVIKRCIKNQMLKPYCKFAMHNILKGDLNKAKKILILYRKYYGFHIMPTIILVSIKTNLGIAKKMAYFYEKINEINSKIICYLKLKY